MEITFLNSFIIALVGGGNLAIMGFILGTSAYERAWPTSDAWKARKWWWGVACWVFGTMLAWAIILLLGRVVAP